MEGATWGRGESKAGLQVLVAQVVGQCSQEVQGGQRGASSYTPSSLRTHLQAPARAPCTPSLASGPTGSASAHQTTADAELGARAPGQSMEASMRTRAADSSWVSRRMCCGQQGNRVYRCCGESQGPLPWETSTQIQNQSCLRLCNSPFTTNSTSSLLLKAIYRFNAIPIKLPMAVFTELHQFFKKICMETLKSLNGQSNLETENRTGGICCPGPRLRCKATGSKQYGAGTKTDMYS